MGVPISEVPARNGYSVGIRAGEDDAGLDHRGAGSQPLDRILNHVASGPSTLNTASAYRSQPAVSCSRRRRPSGVNS